ncbi:MAG TPA: ABC transporter ATP-binding protein [Bacillaceae bacterium]|nr:ABC transporter ATP-binding protein [Paenibacillus bovis]HLU23556.1 ABC transporter ATP-binding protein [Bacillaceae bacterium]
MLSIKDITVSYKDKKVLDKLSLTAEKGEIIGLVAPNGTGKTTLFNVIANYLKPNTGKVTFHGKLSYKQEKSELLIRKHMATFPDQGDLLEELSGVDHMNLYANMWKGTKKHVPQILEQLNMTSYAKKKVKTYSLGMRQRLCFAMMVAADTPIMLMDELMNGLDVENVALISNLLLDMKKQDKLIFVASHLLENLDLYADRVIFLKDGVIIHEHRHGEDSNDYIKLELSPEQYEQILNQLPKDHLYLGNHLCCIPLAGMEITEQSRMLEKLLAYKQKELTIGPLGTVEYYEKYYLDK